MPNRSAKRREVLPATNLPESTIIAGDPAHDVISLRRKVSAMPLDGQDLIRDHQDICFRLCSGAPAPSWSTADLPVWSACLRRRGRPSKLTREEREGFALCCHTHCLALCRQGTHSPDWQALSARLYTNTPSHTGGGPNQICGRRFGSLVQKRPEGQGAQRCEGWSCRSERHQVCLDQESCQAFLHVSPRHQSRRALVLDAAQRHLPASWHPFADRDGVF